MRNLAVAGLGGLILTRHYDATPMRLNFGRLQEDLTPMARYLIPDGLRWKAVPLHVFRRLKPKAQLRFGILEVLAQSASIDRVVHVGGKAQAITAKILCNPVVIERANSSCIFDAVDKAIPALSLESISLLAVQVPWTMIVDVPDNHSANGRRQAETIRRLPRNCLFLGSSCLAHAAHTATVNSTQENDVIGDMHAIGVASSQLANQRKLLQAFWAILEEEFVWHPGCGDPSWREHSSAVLDGTLLRASHHTQGSLCVGDEEPTDRDLSSIGKLLHFANGPISSPICQHFEGDCGQCRTRAEAMEIFYAAVVEAGLLQGSDANACSKNRWLTMTASNAFQTAGMMFHNVLGRSMLRAFKWQDIDDGDPNEDFRSAHHPATPQHTPPMASQPARWPTTITTTTH